MSAAAKLRVSSTCPCKHYNGVRHHVNWRALVHGRRQTFSGGTAKSKEISMLWPRSGQKFYMRFARIYPENMNVHRKYGSVNQARSR